MSGGRDRWGPYEVVVNPVQPYAARKEYLCPGCETTIPPGTFHLVVVPEEAPDLRRHWHPGCWHKHLRTTRTGF